MQSVWNIVVEVHVVEKLKPGQSLVDLRIQETILSFTNFKQLNCRHAIKFGKFIKGQDI